MAPSDTNEGYSDLQVDYQQQSPKHFYPSPVTPLQQNDTVAGLPYGNSEKEAYQAPPPSTDADPRERKRILGLAARTFWIVAAIVAVVVIAAAVGGGVGGSLAKKNNNDKSNVPIAGSQTTTASASPSLSPSPSPSPSSTPSSSSVVAPTTSSSATPSTSSTESTTSLAATGAGSPTQLTDLTTTATETGSGPAATLYVDCPSSNNTFYTAVQDQIYHKVCGLTFESDNYNVVLANTSSLDECINLCASYNVQNATEIAEGVDYVCNAVCWRAAVIDDDYPGVCFGFTTSNSSGAFVYNYDARCDSAALVNQPA